MENTQIVKLHNVQLSKLKEAFNRSLSIGTADTLNFAITKQGISNFAEHHSKSLVKQWNLDITDVCERIEGDFSTIKVAIYTGSVFTSKILGFFGQLADLEIQHVNGSATKIDVVKKDEKGRRALRITLVTASVASSYIDFQQDYIDAIFNTDDTISSIVLSSADLKQLNKLATLSTNPEAQTDYITIKTEDGQLVATDGSFDVALHDRADDIDKIDIDKELFACIEHENYSATIHRISEEQKKLILSSKDSSSKIAIVLLSDADESTNWDDFESSTNWDD